jgi:Rad3-related DNA helicase
VFYLTAKTPGRQLAIDALRQIRGEAAQAPVRVVELVAKDKACEHPGKACTGESCPLALGFYDRLPQARQAALQAGDLSRQTLRSVALAHDICPYYLGQEMTRWSDVVIGDYNHFFDVSAGLHTLTVMENWRVSLLVDEAHNLVERSRQMYTARLDQDSFSAARRMAPPPIKTAMSRVQREWTRLLRDQTEAYQVHAELPEPLIGALQKLVAETTDLLAEDPASQNGAVQAFYFEALHFLRIAELHGTHALFDASLGAAGAAQGARHSVLCLRNVVPAPLLKSRWAVAASATLFSATLSPPEYLQTLLGLPEDTAWIDVPSAFDPAQLQVRVARRISTRYNDRSRSLAQLVELMADQYRQRPGNYLAFFSSYAYLQMALELLGATHPQLPLWSQSAGMDEAQRSEFLARFVPEGQGIGFAVLGGAFGEGIDLPGSRLIGAFIATLGLSQVNPVNEQIRERMQSCLGNGYEYTYLYPGIQKVVQAAGRVIRTTQDQGVVHLMDDRFARPEIRRLLPEWWAME